MRWNWSSNSKAGLESSLTASVKDQVQFYTQYRTDHGSNVPVSGELQRPAVFCHLALNVNLLPARKKK